MNKLKDLGAGTVKFDDDQFAVSSILTERQGHRSVDAFSDTLKHATESALEPDNKKTVTYVFPRQTADARSVEFLFATDRRQEPGPSFGFDRSDTLSFGTAKVHIPIDHKIGRIELPSDWKMFGFTL